MTTEEKAKKYDEALEWMRELYPGLHGATKEDAEHYFPELKDSEDERIRKFLLRLANRCAENSIDFLGDIKKKDVIAWLERQKEQPKEELVYRMNGLMQEYIKEGEDDAEKEHRLKCYQLFWDALEDADFFEQKEQKSITINQDEKEFLADEITAFLCNYDKEFDGEDPVPSEVAEHFYLLGKQAQEQNPVEWSEEDKAMIDDIIFSLPRMANGSIEILPSVAKSYSERLKSLKDRGNFPKSNTNSLSEWSEEDEKMRINILNALTPHLVYSVGNGTYTGASTYRYGDEIRWLKSLSSKLHWKPSEEQIEALSETIEFAPDTFKPKCTLVTLQYDLKKLMEK